MINFPRFFFFFFFLIICKYIKTKQKNKKGNLPYKLPPEREGDYHEKNWQEEVSTNLAVSCVAVLHFRWTHLKPQDSKWEAKLQMLLIMVLRDQLGVRSGKDGAIHWLWVAIPPSPTPPPPPKFFIFFKIVGTIEVYLEFEPIETKLWPPYSFFDPLNPKNSPNNNHKN